MQDVAAPVSAIPAGFKVFRPSSLADIVDAIWDLNVPDGDEAKALTIKRPPGTSLSLILHYGVPFQAASPSQYMVQVQGGVASLRPSGPLGTIIVDLKPEAAARILDAPMREFVDTKIDLRNLLNVDEVPLLEEMLAEARDSRERLATIESFLLGLARRIRPDSLACHAASLLRCDPALPVSQLALQLDISMRHLSRCFQTTFGKSPKQFARLARIEKVAVARCHGGTWSDIAYAHGFADQSHLIREFKEITKQLPEDFFRPPSAGKLHTLNAGTSIGVTFAISRE